MNSLDKYNWSTVCSSYDRRANWYDIFTKKLSELYNTYLSQKVQADFVSIIKIYKEQIEEQFKKGTDPLYYAIDLFDTHKDELIKKDRTLGAMKFVPETLVKFGTGRNRKELL